MLKEDKHKSSFKTKEAEGTLKRIQIIKRPSSSMKKRNDSPTKPARQDSQGATLRQIGESTIGKSVPRNSGRARRMRCVDVCARVRGARPCDGATIIAAGVVELRHPPLLSAIGLGCPAVVAIGPRAHDSLIIVRSCISHAAVT